MIDANCRVILVAAGWGFVAFKSAKAATSAS
jgi:hypothetical protein